MIELEESTVDQENIPPQGNCEFVSKSKVLHSEPQCRSHLTELQNEEVNNKFADSDELNVANSMEKNDVASAQDEEPRAVVARILDELLLSVDAQNCGVVECSSVQPAEDSNSLSSVCNEGDTLPSYGCDFFVSASDQSCEKTEIKHEVTFCDTQNCENFPLIESQSNPNLPLDVTRSPDTACDLFDPMPAWVDSETQKQEEKEPCGSLSPESSPCRTDTMSDCLSNEKDILDVNTNPCCQTPQSDADNNDQLFIETEQPTAKYPATNENEVSENLFVNGESGNLATERRDSVGMPLGRKPLIGVASVNRRPVKSEAKAVLDDQTCIVQATNLSEAGPQVAEFTEEEFRSCAEVFKDAESFEFLQKAGSSAALQESALSRLSLYVKFDPLVKARTPVKEHTSNSQTQDLHTRHTNAAGKLKSETIQEESFSEKDKSIAIAKLIDFTPEKKDTPKATRMVSVEPLQKEQKLFTDGDMKKAMQIQDLLYRERVLSKDREVQDKDKCILALEKKNTELHSTLKTSRCLMEEVFSMLRQWQGKFEQERVGSVESSQKMLKERDQALEDLQNVEAAFADLHRRYEKTKAVLENMKQNEMALREQVSESLGKLKKQEQMYEVLRSRSEEKLESANAEIETARHACHSEVAVLGAQLKKAEMKIASLERSLQHKNQEYIELSGIYDDLIARVGQRS